jgi:hypothetical protein
VNVEVSFFLWVKFMITQERLKEVLSYDSETGVFVWKERNKKYTKRLNGKEAGCLRPDGYKTIVIDQRKYPAHRLAFLYINGSMPKFQIDHINGNGSDNRTCNLREANNAENQQNKYNCHSDNYSGLLGVSFYKERNVFYSRIQINGKQKHLGYFDTPEEAHKAYLNKKRELHPYGEI